MFVLPLQDKERDDLYFAPRVQLPELVPVVTGEEGEREVYSHRAKLYRFDQVGIVINFTQYWCWNQDFDL